MRELRDKVLDQLTRFTFDTSHAEKMRENAREAGIELKDAFAFNGEYIAAMMFSITQAIAAACVDNKEERTGFQDEYHKAVYAGLKKEGWETERLAALEAPLNVRYDEYYQALRNSTEPGWHYWLGKAVARNLGNDSDPSVVLKATGACITLRARTRQFLDESRKILSKV